MPLAFEWSCTKIYLVKLLALVISNTVEDHEKPTSLLCLIGPYADFHHKLSPPWPLKKFTKVYHVKLLPLVISIIVEEHGRKPTTTLISYR